MAFRTLDRTPTSATFTRTVLVGLCLAVLVTIWRLPVARSNAPRENNLSVLGLVLPERVWGSSTVLLIAVAAFVIGVVLWTASSRATVGALIAVAGLILLGSFRVENELYARHQLFQPVLAMGILAGGTALRNGKLDMPRWVWTAAAIAVGWGYTLSGFEKLGTSGFTWADGTSLRVWLEALAGDDPIASWVVRTPWAARLGQTTVLLVETTAVLGLAFRKTRLPYALILLSFHLMMEQWIVLAFYPNDVMLLALCATVFLSRTTSAPIGAPNPV